MAEIDKKLLNWILSIDESEKVYAQAYGSFSLSRMDFNIFINDEEMEKFDEAEKLIVENDGIAPSDEIERNYYRYIQAHNHELFHYYQALTLPAFKVYQRLTRAKSEFEAATMLRFFEHGHSYTLGEDNELFDALKKSDFKLPYNETINFNNIIGKYKFFVDQWTLEYKDISLFHIIEGMAHIMSIQLTPYSKNYLPDTNDKHEYNIAYNIFNSYIDSEFYDIDIRVKHLTFIYICFFSCHTYSLPENTTLEKTSRLFHLLCSKLNLYLDIFTKLVDKYLNYSEDNLKKLDKFNIKEKDIKQANKNQLAQIYAFCELISFIEKDAKPFYQKEDDSSLTIADEFLEILKSFNINLDDIYQLSNFALFPAKMADMWEAYGIIQQSTIGENEFDTAGESAFHELIGSCKKILHRKNTLIPCCSEHGNIRNKLKVLHCSNHGSFSYYLKELTQRESIDLFKIPEI